MTKSTWSKGLVHRLSSLWDLASVMSGQYMGHVQASSNSRVKTASDIVKTESILVRKHVHRVSSLWDYAKSCWDSFEAI